jgi:predicted alpha/beta-hydrolase family hydrolase
LNPHLVFAGRPNDPLVDVFIDGIQAGGVRVTRVLEDVHTLIDAVTPESIVGGFSRGARLSVSVAEQVPVAGLILLGYPFHPKGEPSDLVMRDRLCALRVSTLVLQGERDVHGNRQRIGDIGGCVTMAWLRDGNHRFIPRQSSGLESGELLADAVATALAFIRRLSPS